MKSLPPLKESASQAMNAFKYLRSCPDFIKKNHLWKGYFQHGWMAKITIGIAVLFSFIFFRELQQHFATKEVESGIVQGTMNFFSGIEEVSNELLFSGGMKYLVLIILEMMIFHFSVKTYEKLSGDVKSLTLQDFINAEIRMIKVAIRSWIFELIIGILVMIFLGLIGLGSSKTIVFFLIQCYFFGVAFVDNYNEQFKVSIKDSFGIAFDHFGATFTVGLVAYLLMLIPLVGPILASFICAVGTTCYLYYHSHLPEAGIVESIQNAPLK